MTRTFPSSAGFSKTITPSSTWPGCPKTLGRATSLADVMDPIAAEVVAQLDIGDNESDPFVRKVINAGMVEHAAHAH